MKNMFSKICLAIAALVLSASVGFSLPACPSKGYFHNCFGSYTFSNGNMYVGEWENDEPNGQGTVTTADGKKYVGEYRDGLRNGHFTVNYENGDKFVGEFRDNKRDGRGTYTYADGNKYLGEFKDGNFHGHGVFTTTNSHHYVGEYRDDKRNGRGFYVFDNGRADFCRYIDDEDSNCTGSDVYDVAPILSQKFRNLPEYRRKRVQTNLSSHGLYTSSIDGKWGKNTFVGLASYSALNLKTVNINSAYQANRLLNAVIGNKTASNSKTCAQDPKSCITPAILCSYATKNSLGKKVWETSGNYRQHATEAKSRGLRCGVNSDNAALDDGICGFGNFNACTSDELCKKATDESSKWQSASNLYVKEAKRRGLSCGVNSITATPKQKTCEDTQSFAP